MGIMKSRHTTNLVIKVVDFVAEVSDVASQVFAVLFALGRLHRLASGTRTELLDLHIARAPTTVTSNSVPYMCQLILAATL